MDFTVKNSMIAADFTSFLFNMKQHSKIKNGGRCETGPTFGSKSLINPKSHQSALLLQPMFFEHLCCIWSSD